MNVLSLINKYVNKMIVVFRRLAIATSENKDTKLIFSKAGDEGTSYTDGHIVYITIWKDFLNEYNPRILFQAIRAFIAHECEHIRSSNFSHLKEFAEKIGNYYKNKFNIDERVGINFGKSLYNICEDGRIERIVTYRLPGLVKAFKLINGVIWRKNSISLEKEKQNQYSDLMAGMLCIAKTGVKPKNWDTVYKSTEVDKILNDISGDIFNIINSNTTEEVMKILFIINDKISNFVKEGLEKDAEFLKKLDELQEAGYTAENSTSKQQGQADANGTGANGSGAHIGSSNNSSSGSSSGSNSGSGSGAGSSNDSNSDESVEESMQKANDSKTEKTEDEIEKEIEQNQQAVEQDTTADKEEQRAEAESQKEQQENSDEQLSKEDINKASNEYGVNVSNTHITSYSNGITDANNIEPSEFVKIQSQIIDKKLKPLFLRRDNTFNRNLKKGSLDKKSLTKYLIKSNTSEPYDRIFKQKRMDINPEVVAAVMADISGSTGVNLFNKILDCLAILEGGFAPYIPIKLMTYEGGYSSNNIDIIKDFNNKIKRLSYSTTYKSLKNSGGGTPTAEAMVIGGYELEQRKERKKILFVITDGEPNDSTAVELVTKKIRKKGIKIVPILIQDSYSRSTEERFREMYGNRDCIIANENNFANILISILTNWIKN